MGCEGRPGVGLGVKDLGGTVGGFVPHFLAGSDIISSLGISVSGHTLKERNVTNPM